MAQAGRTSPSGYSSRDSPLSLSMTAVSDLFISVNCAVHPDNELTGIVMIVVIKAGKNAMCDLFNDQFIIRFFFLALPENTIGVTFHVFYIHFCMIELIVSERNGKAGFYFLSFHSTQGFTIVMPVKDF